MKTKFVKAYCKKTKQYFSLDVEKIGDYYKVVNMTHLSDDNAKLLSSEVYQKMFFTNKTLLACTICKNRMVGGCKCSMTKHNCIKDMDYVFDCIYCEEFTIDNSKADSSLIENKTGEKIVLEQGKEVEITFSNTRWKYFDKILMHLPPGNFNEPKDHVIYNDKNIEFHGYNVSNMHEGVYHIIGQNDSFEINCDIDTSTISPHPGGHLGISLGMLHAEVTQVQGKFFFGSKRIAKASNKFNMILRLDKGNNYEIYIDGVKIFEKTIEQELKGLPSISFFFIHGQHNCEKLSHAYVNNIKMKQIKGN